jgi:pyruvate, orthophosphate dikinase
LAINEGRQTRPDIKLGICGEHGGDPSSVEFCHELGLDYVSCSPFRVPIARLAAAQAALGAVPTRKKTSLKTGKAAISSRGKKKTPAQAPVRSAKVTRSARAARVKPASRRTR